jgi:hypothetical protein
MHFFEFYMILGFLSQGQESAHLCILGMSKLSDMLLNEKVKKFDLNSNTQECPKTKQTFHFFYSFIFQVFFVGEWKNSDHG